MTRGSGQGTFGSVYRGTMGDGTEVAIKVLQAAPQLPRQPRTPLATRCALSAGLCGVCPLLATTRLVALSLFPKADTVCCSCLASFTTMRLRRRG